MGTYSRQAMNNVPAAINFEVLEGEQQQIEEPSLNADQERPDNLPQQSPSEKQIPG